MKNPIAEFLKERIATDDFPSAVFLAANGGREIIHGSLGLATKEPKDVESNIETIYDLASLTKVLVTGLLIAKLLERKEINLKDRLAQFFPEFDSPEKKAIAIENLVSHTSGFQAWAPFYFLTSQKTEIRSVIAARPLENPIGAKVVYSDFNFILLGFLLEKIHGKTLDAIAEQQIFSPLGLKNTFFNPPVELVDRIAACEKGNEFEKNTCLESGYDVSSYDWRQNRIRGEVHDGNAYFMGGVSGHAGLFSNAPEVLKIANQFLPDTTAILTPDTCALFRQNLTGGLNEARSVGFQLAETPESTAGPRLSPDSFGHLGFTGTSLWINPVNKNIFILLTNRTYRALPFVNINSTRRTFHQLASDLIERF